MDRRAEIKRKQRGSQSKNQSVKTPSKPGEGDPDSMFVCGLSDDDSIGSAGDLKERIYDEYGEYSGTRKGLGDRGEDVSETISSSVYHAECESVTTHEDDPRITGTTDPAAAIRRGPKPSRASIRARANAKLEQEKKKLSIQDRLLGHEYGEKPLLLDDELDSGEEDDIKSTSVVSHAKVSSLKEGNPPPSTEPPALINLQSPVAVLPKSQPEVAPSAPPFEEDTFEDDVFALAPFSKPVSDSVSLLPYAETSVSAGSRQFLASSDSVQDSRLQTQIHGNDLVTQVGSSLTSLSLDRCEPASSEKVRMSIQPQVIYEESPSEEFPIYENVTLSQNSRLPETEDRHEVYNRPEIMHHGTSASSNSSNNPFTNPFIQSSSGSRSKTTLNASAIDAESQKSAKDVMSQSVDSLTFPQTSADNVCLAKSSSHSSTDLFGSTPFGCINYANKSSASPQNKDLPSTSAGEVLPPSGTKSFTPSRLKGSHFYSVSAETSYPSLTSTPRSYSYKESPNTVQFQSDDVDDEDLFGSVPFKPILGNSHRSFLSLKSRTLPANMSSTLQNQLNHLAMEESSTPPDLFKSSSKISKKMTPPTFRKPSLSHQILSSDSESSTNSSEAGATAAKKVKNRDKSKDRLKYKNIKEEFEEENTMVLPIKQFNLTKKDKYSKKHKKHDKGDKHDKKSEKNEKKSEKADKKSEKADKKSEKADKKSEKADKKSDKKLDKNDKKPEKAEKSKNDRKVDKNLSYESAGISNMSFEDQSLEDSKNRHLVGSRNPPTSPSEDEEAGDLRLTGGNRFGSLKRGINPFSKLSGRI